MVADNLGGYIDKDIQVVLADPEGSGLYNKIKFGVMFDAKESEGTKRRHQVRSVPLLLVILVDGGVLFTRLTQLSRACEYLRPGVAHMWTDWGLEVSIG